ncbi:hypothetical protein [Microbaculum sp. FT89]|uniref:hypothetical protein n=1 Tax=Microbaculum sp. FT89 TaxID=3447298 RepID=UPI003F53E4FA
MISQIAVSMLLAKHRAELAMAFAAKMQNPDPQDAKDLVEAVDDTVASMEREMDELAKGTGTSLDITV